MMKKNIARYVLGALVADGDALCLLGSAPLTRLGLVTRVHGRAVGRELIGGQQVGRKEIPVAFEVGDSGGRKDRHTATLRPQRRRQPKGGRFASSASGAPAANNRFGGLVDIS